MTDIRWEFLFLAAATVLGPLLFRNFLVARQVVTVRGGGVFTINYSTAAQIARSVLKFTLVWVLAIAVLRLENRFWLTLAVVLPPLIGLAAHFPLCKRARVDCWTGKPLT